ncbi:hypothetical protein ABK040_012506 [Willaertia magna]
MKILKVGKEIKEIARVEEKIKTITYGADHVFFLTEDGSVFYFINTIEEENEGMPTSVEFKYLSIRSLIDNKLRKIKIIESGYNIFEYSSIKLGDLSSFLLLVTTDNHIMISKNDKFHFEEFQHPINNEDILFIKTEMLCSLLIVTTNNTIYGTGSNNCGTLGTINKDIYFEKIKFKGGLIKDVKMSVHGSTILLDNNEDVYVTGLNENGELGLGDFENRFEFTKVNLNFKVKEISTYKDGLFILNKNNELYGTGYNMLGELGLGDILKRNVFTKIMTSVQKIYSTLINATALLTCNNELYVCGENFTNYQLGIDNYICKIEIVGEDPDEIRYYIDKFEKIYTFDRNLKYINVILNGNNVLVITNEKVLSGDEELDRMNYLLKIGKFLYHNILQRNLLCDISIKCNIIKKRKRNCY